jgi:hypothetical protein
VTTYLSGPVKMPGLLRTRRRPPTDRERIMKREAMRMPRAYRAAAEAALGAAIAEATEPIYERLVTEAPAPGEAKLGHHLYQNILPGLAIYRALRGAGLGEKEALASVDRAFEFASRRGRRAMEWIGRVPFLFPMLRRSVKLIMRAYPPSGWDTTWLEIGPDRIRFDMTRCYYFDTLRGLGSPELTASFCRIDDLIYQDVSPAFAWRRTKTIARGDDRCDFCFERTAKPRNTPGPKT